jgi:hypothetical protein
MGELRQGSLFEENSTGVPGCALSPVEYDDGKSLDTESMSLPRVETGFEMGLSKGNPLSLSQSTSVCRLPRFLGSGEGKTAVFGLIGSLDTLFVPELMEDFRDNES